MNYLQKKKLAFMSIVNSVKGFVRKISGMPPLTLPDCVDNDSLINYTIDGNSVQNGEPTPDAPVEVESVGEYDEESGKYKIPVVCTDGKGNSVTTNIYLDEPLRKIGEYADYIDFENRKVIRNVSEIILNGTESCGIAGAGTQNERIIYSLSVFNAITGVGNTPSLCTHTKTTTNGNVGWSGTKFVIQVTSTDVRFYRPFYCGIFDFAQKTPAEWKQYLKSLYDSGNPYKVYCVRAEQEETPITIPKLPTIKGTTVYTVGTTIQPANMSATYYATSKE